MTLYIIRPDNNVLDAVHLHLSKLHPQKSFDVTIEPHKAKRTKQQNSYMHVLCRVISDYTGYDVDEVKHKIVDNLNFWVEFKTMEGVKKYTLKSTSDMTTKELNQVIERLQLTCAKLGIKYPYPNWYGYE